MTFNSWVFAVFFLIVFALYHSLRWRAQNLMLLAASLVFYGWWDWRFLGLMALSAGIDYGVALGMPGAAPARRRTLLIASMSGNLGILAAFKYFGFFATSLQALAGALGLQLDLPTLAIVLPVGISFYTFQSMSYTIDVYRGELAPVRDPLLFFLYVSFFPQLVAGPIERATRLLPQLAKPRPPVTADQLASGTLLVLIGLARKVLIADTVAPWVDKAFAAPAGMSSLQLLAGTALFGIQIYCDFAGYSDIARGTARLLGVDLMENFRRPYFATSITDFWRRWHISLSTWLRDYLYIPLGGSRRGRWRTYGNLMTTMLLGGLWHGASWTFVAWGGLHGAALAVHRAVGRDRRPAAARRPWRVLRGAAGWALTMAVVGLGWVFFRAHTFSAAADVVHGILARRDGFDLPWLTELGWAALLVVFLDLPQHLTGNDTVMLRWPVPLRGLIYAGLILGMVLLQNEQNVPFIYFQF